MSHGSRKRFAVVSLGTAILAIWVSVATSTSTAGTTRVTAAGRTSCKTSTSIASARAANPLAKEAAFLAQAATQGWSLTPAGESLAAGAAPPGLAKRADGGLAGVGAMVVATKASTTASPVPLRRIESAKRSSGFIRDVWLYCLSGETANIDYEVHAGSTQFVKWQEHNISTGGDRTRNGPNNGLPGIPSRRLPDLCL